MILKHKLPSMDTAHLTEYLKAFAGKVTYAFNSNGLKGVGDCVKENLEEWKSVPLNVAVIGRSGVGKSSFINTFLGLQADDPGAAKVDVVQCTITTDKYFREDRKNLVIWDLPGVGTKDFPKESYLEQIQFERFDFFIILSASRFTDDDVWLAERVHEKEKCYYFVRTQIDIDISKSHVSHRNPEKKETIIGKIKVECLNGLGEQGLPNQNVYLVANYMPRNYDFDLLCTTLFKDAPDLKRESMTLTFSVLTEGVIRAKEDVLKKRISKVAILSAVGAAIPIPGLSILVDAASLIEEAVYYRRAFGLDDERLKRVADNLNVSLNDLKKSLDLKSTAIVLTTKGITTYCQYVLVSEIVESISKMAIPILGSIIAARASFWSTGICLENLLKVMVEDALKVNRMLRDTLESSIE